MAMQCMRDNFSEGVVLDGRFESVSPLNHGSFGMVFMAKDLQTGDMVAVKCITKSSAATSCPSAMSIDDRSEELACHARLGQHANIVNMIHHFESDAHVYIVLEFCSMGDLYEAIRMERGPRETEHVRDFMFQLVDAVDYMHQRGLYHRDIKPENIFLTSSGDMKLGDFGLATMEAWSTEFTVGSDRYMSPEQYDAAGNGYSPAKADIWAIGICLLNILFYRNPFSVPAESDPLFADYVRDRQSLFDVFPTMSQDTFEVLTHAMAMDPQKRSLDGVRAALQRVVSFTTDDESLDDFCTDDREVVPSSANREPLRTPSISSPQLDQAGSFPWAKALRSSPQVPIRQLSAIPDTEDSTPGLDHVSTVSTEDYYYSLAPETQSAASVQDSALGASLKSLAIPKRDRRTFQSDPAPTGSSVPIAINRPLPAMSMVFGKKRDLVSKSWSDLWDEEEEEEELAALEHDAEKTLQVSGSWSIPSKDSHDSSERAALTESKSSMVNSKTRTPAPQRMGLFGVDVEDHHLDGQPPRYSPPPRYTPPSRRDIMDKWAALGNRRRQYNATRAIKSANNLHSKFKSAQGSELGFFGNDGVSWDCKDVQQVWGVEQDGHGDDGGDIEWVGGWHDLHL